MKKSLEVLILFFLISSVVFSQQVVINGEAPDFKGKEIAVFVYDDLISKKEVEKASAIVDETGKFKFEFSINETQKVFIQVNKQRSSLFIEPGKQYKAFIPPADSTKHVNPSNFSDVGLYVLDNNDSLELNNLIIDFNKKIDDFWMKNYTLFVMSRGRSKLDSFTKATNKNYSTIKNEYFRKHVEYSLASLTQGVSQGKKNRRKFIFVANLYCIIITSICIYLMKFLNSILQKLLMIKKVQV